jgi:serine/threonine protein phosphatase PrpC
MRPVIDVEVVGAQRPAVGESVCGDAFTHVEHEALAFVALADGLGHGPKAAEPARAFCALLEEAVPAEPIELIRKAMARLQDGRGAVGAIIRIDRVTRGLSFCGVGNISLRAKSKEPMAPVCTPGILGRRVTRLTTFSYRMHPGDMIVLHSDGISARFDESLLQGDPKRLVARLMSEHSKSHDDATCVVLRVAAAASA